MKWHILSLFILITAVIHSGNIAFGLGFQEEISITIPNNGQTVDDFTICDIDYDGTPEVLYRSGNSITLYSSSLDSILFETTCDSNAYDINILLGDVNRDSIADIGMATYFPITDYSDSVVLVKIYDGASGYKDSAISYYSSIEYTSGDADMWGGYLLTYGITSFATMDVNSDGFDELILSYGNTASYANYDTRAFRASNGGIYIYNSFPDSIIHFGRTNPVINLRVIYNPELNATLLAMQYLRQYSWDAMMGPFKFNDIEQEGILLYDAARNTGRQHADSLLYCSGGSMDANSSCYSKVVCAGNLTGNPASTEMLTSMSWSKSCQSHSDGQWSWSGGSGTFLYRIYWPDSIIQIGNFRDGYSKGIYFDQYPGTFFAFRYGEFGQYNGQDGVAIQTTSEYPSGIVGWTELNKAQYLLTRNGYDIKLYSVQIATDADGEEGDRPIPSQFSIGKPYPNPFNATQTIPITVMPGRDVKVELYNLLGQKIGDLYNGRPQSGDIEISWSVEHIASGVYFIKATSGQYSDVVKTILLK